MITVLFVYNSKDKKKENKIFTRNTRDKVFGKIKPLLWKKQFEYQRQDFICL
jgi:hypothetical protein